MYQNYLRKALQLGIINVVLILIALFAILFLDPSLDVNAFLIGLPIFLAGSLSLNGCRYLYLGRKEQKDYKFYIGLLTNVLIGLMFVLFIISSFVDLSKLFS